MPRSPQWMNLYPIWFRGSSRGHNQLCGILLQSAHGFLFCEKSKFAISHWLGRSPLTQCWRYRAACDNKIYCRRWSCLSVSETRDAIGFKQQLSTTSFEAFELDIVVNYSVHTSTENVSFMRNLTSWSVPFGLFSWLSTRSSTATRWTRSSAAWLPDNCIPVLRILFSRLSMLPTFQPLSEIH